MLEAMRSLLNTSIDSFTAPRVQPEVQARPEKEPRNKKTYTPNQAVEITLSPKAQQLLRALERQDITVDQIQETERRRLSEIERANAPLPSLDVVIERLNNIAIAHGTPEFSEEDAAQLDRLFREVQDSFAGEDVVDIATSENAGRTASGAQDLPPADRMKAAALFAELDRLLGGMGVFFGGDQLINRLAVQKQPQAQEMKSHLAATLSPGTPASQLTPAQESRIDAILREIDRLYARASDGNADARRDALGKLLNGGGIQQSGGADLAA